MKRIIFCIVLLMTAALLLTGCHEEWGLRITLKNAPDYTKAGICLPDGNDSWLSAAELEGVSVNGLWNKDGLLLSVSGSKDLYAELCEQYQVCRIVLLDKDGKTVTLSQDITLASADKAGYPKDLTYDFRHGHYTVENWFGKKLFGKTADGWYFISVIASWMMLIPFFAAMLLFAAFLPDERERRVAENLTILFCSIPAVLTVIFRMYLEQSPVFNLDGDPFSAGDILLSLVLVFPWTIALIYLAVIALKSIIKKTRKE